MNASRKPALSPEKISDAYYFGEVEKMILKRLHAEAESDDGRAELMRSTGMDDPQLIDELCQLGVTAEGLIAMRLFPLVMVAWAEERVDGAERVAVMKEAANLGIVETSVAGVLLDSWLQTSPRGISVDAWKRYVRGMMQSMTPLARQKLIQLAERQMLAVAKASGGHFGIGSVSKAERVMIHKLVEVMQEQAKGPIKMKQVDRK